MRLQVWIAKAGIASRRAAEQLIREGRVAVNGVTVTAMGTKVSPNDQITYDGRPIKPLSALTYLAVHKPVGVLCTQKDERNRAKVIDLLPEPLRPGIFHVGRLDFMSSGLIFYTNDGNFGHIVMHPSTEIEKEYRLETEIAFLDQQLNEYCRGIHLDGDVLRLKSFTRETPKRVRLTLTQGKNREIRRACAYFKLKISRLCRIRIGCVNLDGISPGRFRHLTNDEVAWFLRDEARGPVEADT